MDKQDSSLMQRDPLALVMFAAWCNLPAGKLPIEMRAHTCPATAEAWGRVAAAVRSFMGSDEVELRAGEALILNEYGDANLWSSMTDDEKREARIVARAILSSALGGDAG